MSVKTLRLLAALFIVLAIIASRSWWQEKLPGTNKKQLFLNPAIIDEKTLTKVEIKTRDEIKTFLKESNSWQIDGITVDTAVWQTFFKDLQELTAESVVSRNPDNYQNFGIDAKNATTVQFFRNDATATAFMVGRYGPATGTFYAKLGDSNNIHLVQGNLSGKLSQNKFFWQAKTIINIAKADIQKITLIQSNRIVTLTESGDDWLLSEENSNTKIDSKSLDSFFLAVNPLEADSFLTLDEWQEFQQRKERDKARFKIHGRQDKFLIELILLPNESDWWVQNQDYGYKIGKTKGEILTFVNVAFTPAQAAPQP